MIGSKEKEKEKERRVLIHSTTPSEGIELDSTLERRSIPPPWHRVVHGTITRSLQESVHHNITVST